MAFLRRQHNFLFSKLHKKFRFRTHSTQLLFYFYIYLLLPNATLSAVHYTKSYALRPPGSRPQVCDLISQARHTTLRPDWHVFFYVGKAARRLNFNPPWISSGIFFLLVDELDKSKNKNRFTNTECQSRGTETADPSCIHRNHTCPERVPSEIELFFNRAIAFR